MDTLFISFQFHRLKHSNLGRLEELLEHTALQLCRTLKEILEVLQAEEPLVYQRFTLIDILVEVGQLHIYICKLIVENLLGIDIHELHLTENSVIAALLALRKRKVEDADSIDILQLIIPVALLSLFRNRKCGIEYRPVLVEVLIDILHLDNETAAVSSLAIHIEDGLASILITAELLAVTVFNILNDPLAIEHGIEETHQQVAVERSSEDALKTEIGQRIDISLTCVYHRSPGFYSTKIQNFLPECKLFNRKIFHPSVNV